MVRRLPNLVDDGDGGGDDDGGESSMATGLSRAEGVRTLWIDTEGWLERLESG